MTQQPNAARLADESITRDEAIAAARKDRQRLLTFLEFTLHCIAIVLALALASAAASSIYDGNQAPDVTLGFLLGSFVPAGFSWWIRAQFRRMNQSVYREGRIAQLEERSLAEPAQPKLAWDLARSKLESYLDRNLDQVGKIFNLTLLVMLCGMALIGVGVWRAIDAPKDIAPAALSSIAGVIVQCIAGTFLIIYRSTMSQAREYVVVLERINAVGMSINILEGIEGEESDRQLRNAAKRELARDLLRMYGVGRKAAGLKTRKRTRLKDGQKPA